MPSPVLLADLLAAAAFAVLAATDLLDRRLPRRWMALFVLLALAGAMLRGGATGLGLALVSGLVAAFPFWALRRLRPRQDPRWQLGGGDLRLAFALGAWLGALPALLLLAAASALAGLAGLALRRSQPLGSWCFAAWAVAAMAGRFWNAG